MPESSAPLDELAEKICAANAAFQEAAGDLVLECLAEGVETERNAVTVHDPTGAVAVLDSARHAISLAETQDDIEAIEIRLKAVRPEIRRIVKDQDEQRGLMREHAIAMFDLYRKGGELLEPFVMSAAEQLDIVSARRDEYWTAKHKGERWEPRVTSEPYYVLAGLPRTSGAQARAKLMRCAYLLPGDIYDEVCRFDWTTGGAVGLKTFMTRWRTIRRRREWDALPKREKREREHGETIDNAVTSAQALHGHLRAVLELPDGWPGPLAYERLITAIAEAGRVADQLAVEKEPAVT